MIRLVKRCGLIRKPTVLSVLATCLSKIAYSNCASLTALEGIMAALRAVLFVTALLSCGVNGQFNVTIPCPSSGKKTLMSVSVYIYFV